MIRLTTSRGSVSYDPEKGSWRGNRELRAVIDAFPDIPVRLTPVGDPIGPDHADERWVFLHAYWALKNAGDDVFVRQQPVIEKPAAEVGMVQ